MSLPLDRVTLLLQVQADLARAGGGRPGGAYANFFTCLVRVVEAEGRRGLWRGAGVLVVRTVGMAVAMALLRKPMKALVDWLLQSAPTDSPGKQLVGGAVAGTLSTAVSLTVVHPADTIFTLLAADLKEPRGPLGVMAYKYAGGLDALRTRVASEGALSLYRGLGWTLAGMVATQTVWFTVRYVRQRLAAAAPPPPPEHQPDMYTIVAVSAALQIPR